MITALLLLALALSFILSSVITPLIIFFYRKCNWIDQPGPHRHIKVLHTKPITRGGGIVVFVSIMLVSSIFVPLNSQMVGIFIGSAILAMTGILDDVYDIHPFIRLIVGISAAGAVVFSGVGIEYVSHPFQPDVIHLDAPSITIPVLGTLIQLSILADAFAIIWIVWNMNIVNWSKGLDGQLPGLVSIASIFIGLLSLRFINDPTQHHVTILAFIVAGSFAGLLFWNAYPQKILPGYGAGSLGGYFLAVLSILSGAKLATALLVLAIPTADALFTISRRLLRKKSPFWGDRGHLHHKLLDVLGWSKAQIAWFYWISTAILGFLAIQLKPGQKLFTIIAVFCGVFGILIWLKLFFSSSKQPDRDNG